MFCKAYRLVFLFFLGFVVMSAPVFAQSNPLFTVEGVEVDVTAESALKAREQAFRKAQTDAFAILSERLLSEGEIETFQQPMLDVISTFVRDFEITQEKRSSVRYVATYTFRFDDEAVRRYFSGSGVGFTDVASKPLLVLPFYQHGSGLGLWSPYNLWMQAWNRAPLKGGLVPIVVPIGDLSDVRDISDQEALSYDQEKLGRLLQRYGAGEAVLLIAVPDEELQLVSNDDEVARGGLGINVYRTDRNGPEFVQGIQVNAQDVETRKQLFDRGVVEVQKFLRRDWKARTIAQVQETAIFHVRVGYQGFPQWAETRKALNNVNGVNEVNLKSLSPKEARLEIVFRGNEDRLRLALRQADFTLSKPVVETYQVQQNLWGEQPEVVYELYLNKFAPRPPAYDPTEFKAPMQVPASELQQWPPSEALDQQPYRRSF